MPYKKEQGSAHVAIVIALVFVIAGTLGYILWRNFMSIEPVRDAVSNSSTADVTKQIEEDPYEGWKTYNSKLSSGLSLKYPSTWVVPSESSDVLINSGGGESLTFQTFSAKPVREPLGPGAPGSANNVYMCVMIDEYGGEWHHSPSPSVEPSNKETLTIGGEDKLTLATYLHDTPMEGGLLLLGSDSKKQIATNNGYVVVVSASFNCVQADGEILESMSDDFEQREETKIAKQIIKSIRW